MALTALYEGADLMHGRLIAVPSMPKDILAQLSKYFSISSCAEESPRPVDLALERGVCQRYLTVSCSAITWAAIVLELLLEGISPAAFVDYLSIKGL